MGTSTPAMAATFSDHGPAALMTTSAWISVVTAGDVVVDDRAAHDDDRATSSALTSVYGRIVAPLCCAVAKKRSGSRIASIEPSGTRTAAFSSGFRFGSSASASPGVSRRAGIPDGLAALEQRLEVLHVLVFDGDEQAVVQLEASGADPPEDHVLLDALDRRLAVVDRVAPAAVEHPVVATRRARGHLAPLHQRDAQAAKREVVRQRTAGATAAHDENVPVAPIGFHLKSSIRPDETWIATRCGRSV